MRLPLVLILVVAIAAATFAIGRRADEAPARGAVSLVGDSLNVGIEPYLADELGGWRIDARDRVGRTTEEGLKVLRLRRVELAAIVVVSLGTNDPDGSEAPFAAHVDEAVELVGPDRCLVWATIVRGGSPRAGFNQVLEQSRSQNPTLRLVDWARMVRADDSLLAGDLVHGTPAGYARRAEETARAVRGCAPEASG
jgi:hypothetical protein